MNLDLSVRFNKEFLLGDLLYHSGQALMELLALPNIPEFIAEIEEEDKLSAVDGEFLCGTHCPILFISFRGNAEKIKMVIYEIDPQQDFLPEEEKGLRAGILAGDGEESAGGPLQFALAASTAVGLARVEGSKIRDYKLSLGSKELQTPGELIQSVKANESFKAILAGAQALFQKKNLAVFDQAPASSQPVEAELDQVLLEMLRHIKVSKKVDMASFTRFYRLFDQMIEASEKDAGCRRSLIGFLSLIYEYLLEELRYAQDRESFKVEIGRLKEKIQKLGFGLPV